MGKDVCVMACKIRGIRDPSRRQSTPAETRPTALKDPQLDDGTRIVQIIGCEYRLSESEILNWIGCFGEVLSEITEERFGQEDSDPDLPAISNGTYLVKMKPTRDFPNL